MKLCFWLGVALMGFRIGAQPDVSSVKGEGGSTEQAATETPTVAAMPVKPSVASREELEKAFQKSLEGVTLAGTWQMTGDGGLKGADPLSEPRAEKYFITSAVKMLDEYWLINARIQFADQDVTVPVPVRVVWAEDTAIITLSEFPVPMLGTYSCRVMFHEGFYSGVWYSKAKNYGGVMSGRMVRGEAPKPASTGEKTDRTKNEE